MLYWYDDAILLYGADHDFGGSGCGAYECVSVSSLLHVCVFLCLEELNPGEKCDFVVCTNRPVILRQIRNDRRTTKY